MAKKKPDAPADKVELYDKLIATNPEIERKGAANAYTSVNGHMFSFLTKEGTLALRLNAEDREAFLKKFKTQLCVQHNTVMKEYVEVPDKLLNKTKDAQPYFEKSYAYVSALKPKPTTRKKKAGAKKAPAKKAGKAKKKSRPKRKSAD